MFTNVVANLSVCLARLGRYADQDTWATKVAQISSAEFTGFAEVQLTYSLALGHAMRNRPVQALDMIAHVQERLVGRIPGWIRQAWALWKADILFISGKRLDALRTAEEVLEASSTLLLSFIRRPFRAMA